MGGHATKTAVGLNVLEARRDALLRIMSEHKLDRLVITSVLDILFFTGIDIGGSFSRQALILDKSGQSRYVLRHIENHWADRWVPLTWCKEWRSFQDHEAFADVVARAARELDGGKKGRLGLQLLHESMPYASATVLANELSTGDLISIDEDVNKLRAIKNADEIAMMREAGVITRKGMEAAAKVIADGGTDIEAIAEAFSAMSLGGADLMADFPYVAVGAETAMAHARWSSRAPDNGEVVPIYMSASRLHYVCPSERTYVKGEPSARTQALLDASIAAIENVLKNLKPGMTSGQADALGRDVIRDAGFGEYFYNRLAYSIGLANPPVWWENDIMQLRPNDQREVKAGMAFHLVPALHVPGVGFVNRSMPIVVTETGCEPLCDLPLRVPNL